MSEEEDDQPLKQEPLINHLLELRTRLLKILIGVVLVFTPCAYFARDLFSYLSGPLLAAMPAKNSLIATGVAAPFLAPFKLAMLVAVAISLPWTLFQIWMFTAPALYKRERKLIIPLLASSTFLFFAGMAFAYYVIFPIIFRFFISVAPAGVQVTTDISAYLDFVLKLFMAFGAAFEMPVAIFLIVWTGFVSTAQLGRYRPYVIIAAFAFGMLLTPPDIISQTCLAVPLYLLYEVGILAARLLLPDTSDDADAG
ncbi:twin-arginine translocase subunit TatC [Salinisphaera sp. USBA-960]|uniref:twin-arginine translocase subunit TatC n=1 Tax=Salinisphaera orenii TaxID=856731 RepID=UPI000DBE06D6|nr:twin-arginine translocase subunit TatC [Salifodinibacter halophilus]NNC25495.1 twin-arginine translocase subunit TatC [Salifodinibacter halophilus]